MKREKYLLRGRSIMMLAKKFMIS